MNRINEYQRILPLVFKALGVSMAVAAVVLNLMKAASTETQILLMGLGLFSLALNALQKEESNE